MTKAITGFRFLRTQAGFFDALPPREQRDWSEELSSRLRLNPDAKCSVCVLDTGLAVDHPLLRAAIAANGVDSCNPQDWGTDDHHGHGTAMAGIALFGDLTPVLESAEAIEIGHILESVKVFPPDGHNQDEHVGYITAQAIARTETNRPDLKRAFCLSWTIPHKMQTREVQVTAGRPTPLSAKLDQLAFGVEESDDWRIDNDRKRLLIVSAGNIPDFFGSGEYPDINNLYEIEDPAQAWNALTVGAYTEKTFTNDPTYDGWSALAGLGQLSPRSRTSVLWGQTYWPTKPDIVLEGGNYLANGAYFEDHPDTCPLTTDKDSLFAHTKDTSAANAEAARLAAMLASHYPGFWPESIRGLLVHSAEWTAGMVNERSYKNKARKIAHLRRYGYGVPRQEFLINSFSNRPCVVIQDYLQPFAQSDTGPNIVFKDMNYYVLPWPREQLRAIVEQAVKLRVTLSYFIEPSPSERPPKTKYSYASHDLRFRLNRPNESEETFLARINKELQIEEINEELSGVYEISDQTAASEQDKWMLGVRSRDRGSLISDIWEGTGPGLADQNLIAVVPQVGWWKFRKSFPNAEKGRFNQRVRYSLILSLICETEVDLYTPITQQIGVPVEIAV
ncbi:MAG: S8 family peptidase [Rhodospirillales bacterium]